MRGVVWPLIVTTAIQALASMAIFSPPVFAPVAHDEFGVPASWVGLVTALTFGSATVGALFSGGVIARVGALRMSQYSLLLCGAGISMLSTAVPWAVLLGAVVMGLGYGPVTPSSSSILADRTPERVRNLVFSIKQTGVPIGGALAGAVVPLLILALGWKTGAVIAGLACVAMAIAIQPYRRSVDLVQHASTRAPSAGLLEPLRLVLGNPRLREMGFASATFSGSQACLGTFLVVYLTQRNGFSLQGAGAALSTAMTAGIIGRIAWGLVADRGGKPRTLLGLIGVGMSAAAVLTASFTAMWPLAGIFAVSFLYGLTATGWNGIYLSEVARIAPPGRAAAATGASLAMTYAGVVLLPMLFWAIVGISDSYALAYCVAASLTLWRASFFFRRG